MSDEFNLGAEMAVVIREAIGDRLDPMVKMIEQQRNRITCLEQNVRQLQAMLKGESKLADEPKTRKPSPSVPIKLQ
jgi:hypothetical protein